MAVNAPFYVYNEDNELVPAKFLAGPDGRYITPSKTIPRLRWNPAIGELTHETASPGAPNERMRESRAERR
jgi:hypothetical protein